MSVIHSAWSCAPFPGPRPLLRLRLRAGSESSSCYGGHGSQRGRDFTEATQQPEQSRSWDCAPATARWPCMSAPPSRVGRNDGKGSFLPACSFYSPPKGLCITLMFGTQEVKECRSSQSGCSIEATYRVERTHALFRCVLQSCLLHKIDVKSHGLVPSQSKGDVQGREVAMML